MKPVYNLYEIWCYFQLRKALCDITSEEGEPELSHQIKDMGYTVDLKRGARQYTLFKYKNLTLRFYYERQFRPPNAAEDYWHESYSTFFKPDFTIEILKDGETPTCIHFDAKYRLNTEKWKKQFDDNNNATYKYADIHVMHAYKDAILSAIGSYVLYPGEEKADVFVHDTAAKTRATAKIPSVGAFPLKPCDNTLNQVELIKKHMVEIFDKIR